MSFVRGTLVDRTWKIEEVPFGEDVRTWLPGEIGYSETWPVILTVREREVRLVQERDGARAEVALLRPESWFADSGVSVVGDCVRLNLEELDLAGAFRVLDLGEVRVSTHVRRAGFGRVTGRFQFSQGETFNLFVAGESRPLGVTGRHPFWSADRNAWVEVRELKAGERVLVEGGTRVVEKVEVRGEESVHNIEVEGDHCYRVGEQGVMVHNISAPPVPCPKSNQLQPKNFRTVTFQGSFVQRATGYEAVIVKKKHVRANFATSVPPWWAAYTAANPLNGSTWEKGHLLGSSFGGPASIDNLAPQTFEVNRSIVNTCDNRIREALKCGCVTFSITFLYGADPLRPTGFLIDAVGKGGVSVLSHAFVSNDGLGIVPLQCILHFKGQII